MANIVHPFHKKQSIEKEVKDLYLKFTVGNPTAATATLNLNEDIVLTASTTGTSRNDDTFTIEVEAAAANPTDTVLIDFTGDADDIIVTVTPNDGTNNTANPDAAATAVLNLTADITLTSVAAGTVRNTTTLTTEVAAAAANPTDTVLADFTGTASAIVVTITPNDGTNNGATPVDLTTAELVELINTGAVAGKTVTVTDASNLRALQTATGGDATALADAGEGDSVLGTFSGGTNDAVSVTTADLVELINDGVITGKNPTITDASSLRELQTATGGDTTDLADAGEGDSVSATFAGGDGNTTSIDTDCGIGIASVERTDVGEYTITLEDRYPSLKHLKGTILSSTAVDGRVQIKSQDVSSAKTIVIYTLTAADPTDLTDGTKVIVQMDLKNTAQPY